MKPKRTYLDSGVLIAASRGTDEAAIKALSILDDENREFTSSSFVKLEILAKAIYHKREQEVAFYESFFTICIQWADDLHSIIELAQNLASKYGLAG